MRKYLIFAFTILLMSLSLTTNISAEDIKNYIIDEGQLLSSEMIDNYNAEAKTIEDKYHVETLFAVVNDDSLNAEERAYLIFDQYRTREHAVLYVVNQYDDSVALICSGLMGEVLTETLMDEIYGYYLASFDIEAGALNYLTLIDEVTGLYLEEWGYHPEDVPNERLLPRVYDEADLLNDDEEVSLLALVDEISERQMCDVAIATFNQFEGESIVDFADDFYDYNGFGYGRDRNGIMLVISLAERDYCLTTLGYGLEAFNDYGLEELKSEFMDDLSYGYYYDSFVKYANFADYMLTLAHQGQPLDYPEYEVEDNEDFEEESMDYNDEYQLSPFEPEFFIGSLAIGITSGLVTVIIWLKQLKTVHHKNTAFNYENLAKRNIYRYYDHYTHTDVSRRKIERSDSSSSSGGSSHSSSSSHHSSSGSSHGGSSGKF